MPTASRHISVPMCLFLALVAGGCKKASPAGRYHIEQDGNVFGAGAEKITLDLRSDGSFAVQAGPKVTMLDGTWEHKSGQVTFSKEQGSIVVSYRVEGTALVPIKDGKDLTNWRWRRD